MGICKVEAELKAYKKATSPQFMLTGLMLGDLHLNLGYSCWPIPYSGQGLETGLAMSRKETLLAAPDYDNPSILAGRA